LLDGGGEQKEMTVKKHMIYATHVLVQKENANENIKTNWGKDRWVST